MTDISIGMLQDADLQDGFLESLDSLSKASNMDHARAREIFSIINSDKNHTIIVARAGGKIVGSATLLVEQKFIHDGGRAGHIEDVVVSKAYQGQDIGRRLVEFLLDVSRERGCYKTILDCTKEVEPFYQRLGFKRAAGQMRYDHF